MCEKQFTKEVGRQLFLLLKYRETQIKELLEYKKFEENWKCYNCRARFNHPEDFRSCESCSTRYCDTYWRSCCDNIYFCGCKKCIKCTLCSNKIILPEKGVYNYICSKLCSYCNKIHCDDCITEIQCPKTSNHPSTRTETICKTCRVSKPTVSKCNICSKEKILCSECTNYFEEKHSKPHFVNGDGKYSNYE